MRAYIRVLRQRVRDSRYAVDEGAVADAVLARARPRRVTADRADARKHLARLEQQIKQFRREDRAAAAPARSVRRATARRASTRRATARSRQSDTTARIVKFLTRHPQSTTGDLARSLNLDPESVSTSLNQLENAGDIKKHAHGFSTQ
jgi:predicted transcriptional regulator